MPLQALQWEKAPDYVVEGQGDWKSGAFFLRRDNTAGVVEVRDSATMDLVWKARIDGYDEHVSLFKLSGDGRALVHVVCDFGVHDLEDLCVEVYRQDGQRIAYRAGDLMTKLQPVRMQLAGGPTHLWMAIHWRCWDTVCKGYIDDASNTFRVLLREGRYAVLSLGEKQVTYLDEAKGKALPEGPTGKRPRYVVEGQGGGLAGDCFLRRDNAESTVEVRDSATLDPLWTQRVTDYSPEFSLFKLGQGGDCLVHWECRPSEDAVDDDDVTIYLRDDAPVGFRFRDFASAPAVTPAAQAGDASRPWLANTKRYWENDDMAKLGRDRCLTFKLADGTTINIDLVQYEVSVVAPR